MTTIAVKDGIMACDSCWTDSNELVATSLSKIIRLKSGALLGEAGDNDSRAVVKLLQSVKNFDQMPMPLDLAACCVDYCAVILFPDGDMAQILIERNSSAGESAVYVANAWPVNRGHTAVGTGAGPAIGAMKAGKSAREAVAISCDVDPNSRLPVHSACVEPCKKRPRAKTKAKVTRAK